MNDNVAAIVGNTPLVRLNNIGRHLDATIAVKLEYLNPTCSVKDRIAVSMVQDAEEKGLITPGKSVLVEGTSGNLGVALAMVGRIRGYKVILVMPSTYSVERRTLLKAYGAEVILTDTDEGMEGVMTRVRQIIEAIPHAHTLDQFSNASNPFAHYKTTGPEIWKQTDGKVDMVCFGVGSGGTLTGVGRFLKEQNPNIQVYAVEPYESSVINGHPPAHHKIQGIGAGIIPDNLDMKLVKKTLRVPEDDAIQMTRRLAEEEGILGGVSSGANVCAALRLAEKAENAGKLIVTTVNSFGERYLSTELYSNLQQESQEMRITSAEESMNIARKYTDQ